MTTPSTAPTTGTHAHNGAAPSHADMQAWRDAVAIVAQRALDYYGPKMAGRVDKARRIVLDGLVQTGREMAYVRSETDPETTYDVTSASCTCLDAQRSAPNVMCKHRLAWQIYRGAYGVARGLTMRQTPREPLPEAPISICMKGPLAGVPGTLVTLRGRDMDEIVARAAQVKARAACLAGMFDAGADATASADETPSETADAPGDGAPAPLCPDHDPPMRPSQFGGWYCPQVVGESFCKVKVKRRAR
jgi:hypothetical protein